MPEPELQESELRQKCQALVQQAQAIRITHQESYDQACWFLQQQIIPWRKTWDEYWKPLRESAWRHYKLVQGKFIDGDEPAAIAERTIKEEIKRWDEIQIKIEAERQRQAQQAAEKEAEEERLQAAIMAADSGASESEVQAIVDTTIAVVADPIAPAYVRAGGISRRKHFKAIVTDLWKLVKAAAKDKALLAYLQPNQSALDKRAQADELTMNIPGVVAKDMAIIAAKGK